MKLNKKQIERLTEIVGIDSDTDIEVFDSGLILITHRDTAGTAVLELQPVHHRTDRTPCSETMSLDVTSLNAHFAIHSILAKWVRDDLTVVQYGELVALCSTKNTTMCSYIEVKTSYTLDAKRPQVQTTAVRLKNFFGNIIGPRNPDTCIVEKTNHLAVPTSQKLDSSTERQIRYIATRFKEAIITVETSDSYKHVFHVSIKDDMYYVTVPLGPVSVHRQIEQLREPIPETNTALDHAMSKAELESTLVSIINLVVGTTSGHVYIDKYNKPLPTDALTTSFVLRPDITSLKTDGISNIESLIIRCYKGIITNSTLHIELNGLFYEARANIVEFHHMTSKVGYVRIPLPYRKLNRNPHIDIGSMLAIAGLHTVSVHGKYFWSGDVSNNLVVTSYTPIVDTKYYLPESLWETAYMGIDIVAYLLKTITTLKVLNVRFYNAVYGIELDLHGTKFMLYVSTECNLHKVRDMTCNDELNRALVGTGEDLEYLSTLR